MVIGNCGDLVVCRFFGYEIKYVNGKMVLFDDYSYIIIVL